MNATSSVVESLTIVKVMRLVLVKPAINGLLSIAPKKPIPTIVVSQSIVPLKIMAKLGTVLILSIPASSSLFPLNW